MATLSECGHAIGLNEFISCLKMSRIEMSKDEMSSHKMSSNKMSCHEIK